MMVLPVLTMSNVKCTVFLGDGSIHKTLATRIRSGIDSSSPTKITGIHVSLCSIPALGR